jgi:hypothetical protein
MNLKTALGFSTDLTDFTDGTEPDSSLDPVGCHIRKVCLASCSTFCLSAQSV